MKRLIGCLGLGICLLIPGQVSAKDSAPTTFQDANAHYVSGEYVVALKLYDQLVDEGLRNPILFLNRGNAHFRLDAWGRAVHSYRSGLRLNPHDKRVQQTLEKNLEVARLKLADRYRSGSENRQFIYQDSGGLIYKVTHSLGEDLLSTLFLVFWALFCGCLILRRVKEDAVGLGAALATSGLATLCFALLLWGQVATHEGVQLGVVVDAEVTLREAPHGDASGHPIPEGMEVEIIHLDAPWSHVSLANGRQGFIRRDVLWPL